MITPRCFRARFVPPPAIAMCTKGPRNKNGKVVLGTQLEDKCSMPVMTATSDGGAAKDEAMTAKMTADSMNDSVPGPLLSDALELTLEEMA